MGIVDENPDTQDYLLRRIILCLEENKTLSAIKSAVAYAKSMKHEKEEKHFKTFLEGKLSRRIAKLDIIKGDLATAFEYYDDDRRGDPYAYDEETEATIRTIEEELYLYVGKILASRGLDIQKIIKGL